MAIVSTSCVMSSVYECVKGVQLLAEGANVHHICNHSPGGTALHVAVFYEQSRKIVSELIRYGKQ